MRTTIIRMGIVALLALPVTAQAQVTMKASHQFPGGKGDVRDDMVQMIAKAAQAANVGLTVQVYPGASLFKPNQQWNALVDGQLDISLFALDNANDTSLGTFDSTRLYEVTDCLTAPGNNALWFMYEPVLMSKKSLDKLNKAQQDALIKAGKDAQAYFEGKADAVNNEAIKDFEDHKVKVVTLGDADYNTWLDLAKKTSYAKFAKDVPNGQKLIDEALAVK